MTMPSQTRSFQLPAVGDDAFWVVAASGAEDVAAASDEPGSMMRRSFSAGNIADGGSLMSSVVSSHLENGSGNNTVINLRPSSDDTAAAVKREETEPVQTSVVKSANRVPQTTEISPADDGAISLEDLDLIRSIADEVARVGLHSHLQKHCIDS